MTHLSGIGGGLAERGLKFPAKPQAYTLIIGQKGLKLVELRDFRPNKAGLIMAAASRSTRQVRGKKAQNKLNTVCPIIQVMRRMIMKTPFIYRCVKTITMQSDGTQAFTAGQLYRGHPSADPGGDWLMLFKNDQGKDHGIGADWLREYFSLVEEGAEVVETFEDEAVSDA